MPKIHSYQQVEQSDCGLTCIRILARYWGQKVSLNYLRGLCDLSRSGMTVGEIVECFNKIGMHSIALNIPYSKLGETPLPSILYWKKNHFVVLYKIAINRKGETLFHIVDPSIGKIEVKEADFKANWCGPDDFGFAVLAEPGEKHNKLNNETNLSGGIIRLMKDIYSRHKLKFVTSILLTILGMGADFVLPLLVQETVDEGIALRDIHLVWILALSQLFVYLGYYLTSSFSSYFMTRLGLDVGFDMLSTYLLKLIHMPMEFFERKVSSDLLQKAEDQNRLKNFLVTTPQTILFSILSIFVLK